MTKPSYGWGHTVLETLLGTPTTTPIPTVVVSLTDKQKGQIIGAIIGGVIALAFIGGVIYCIRLHRKKGSRGDIGTTPADGYWNKAELDVNIQRAELGGYNARTELDANGTSSSGNMSEPAVDGHLTSIITTVLAPPQGEGTYG